MKKGISLIVLVITIIVMIILAASVVITLSNTGIIDRANQAVSLTNQSQVQDLAALIWADAYMDGKRGTVLESEVTTKLSEQGVTATDWDITVTDSGVTIVTKGEEVNIITFKLNEITFQADKDMTWANWIQSSYTNGNAFIWDEDYEVIYVGPTEDGNGGTFDLGMIIFTADGNPVSGTEKIKSNYNYIVKN